MSPKYHIYNKSLFRKVRLFGKTWNQLKKPGGISRAQLIYLDYLIEGGFNGWFRIKQTTFPGLSYELSRGYLLKLQKIGFVDRCGGLWKITTAAQDYYTKFIVEFNRRLEESPHW